MGKLAARVADVVAYRIFKLQNIVAPSISAKLVDLTIIRLSTKAVNCTGNAGIAVVTRNRIEYLNNGVNEQSNNRTIEQSNTSGHANWKTSIYFLP